MISVFSIFSQNFRNLIFSFKKHILFIHLAFFVRDIFVKVCVHTLFHTFVYSFDEEKEKTEGLEKFHYWPMIFNVVDYLSNQFFFSISSVEWKGKCVKSHMHTLTKVWPSNKGKNVTFSHNSFQVIYCDLIEKINHSKATFSTYFKFMKE